MEYSCKVVLVTKLPYFHVKLATLKVALLLFRTIFKLSYLKQFSYIIPIVLSLSRDSTILLLENMQIMQG